MARLISGRSVTMTIGTLKLMPLRLEQDMPAQYLYECTRGHLLQRYAPDASQLMSRRCDEQVDRPNKKRPGQIKDSCRCALRKVRKRAVIAAYALGGWEAALELWTSDG